MTPEDRSSYGWLLEHDLIPTIKEYIAVPPSSVLRTLIQQWTTKNKASLPRSISAWIDREGRMLEDHFNSTFGFTPSESSLASIATYYSYGPNALVSIEDYILGASVADQAQLNYERVFGEQSTVDQLVYTAEAQVALSRWSQLLKTDPTGFSLLDHLVYDPPHPRSPLAAASQFPPLIELSQLGVQRYKNLYGFFAPTS